MTEEDRYLPVLERECQSCDGYGKVHGGYVCGTCNGTGYALTDAGEQVTDLLRHQFKRLLRENIG